MNKIKHIAETPPGLIRGKEAIFRNQAVIWEFQAVDKSHVEDKVIVE